MTRPRVFFDFSINAQPAGRLVFELFTDSAPKTCENFRALCTGERGLSPAGNPLYYKNSIIHRSIPGFMIQGGDFTKRNGSGGESIYGGMFADEDLSRSIDSEGLLCMANKGPDTNGSQFFVTLRDCHHLDGRHVVFGKVLKGYKEVVEKIVDVPVDEKDRPTVPVVVTNCGELELRRPALTDAPTLVPNSQKHRKRSTSPALDTDQRRSKKKHRKHRNTSPPPEEETPKTGETEEEYDARLEREEKERIEHFKKMELEKLKKAYKDAAPATVSGPGGVRFKGRGRMKFIDPETSGVSSTRLP
ncbi:hypothetical protein BDN72DRAFT_795403 [Pluteus cervinus]|uniref:Uncharacterized protein n=1 Tax=Pluteus cervinus TaxID=181527 RepID=A0ACD3AX56_9AGAR|nr:hypothetical protein BDN72DRAFT_795403 [Pluteus cervinus]